MIGKVIAVNPRLGAVVIETKDHAHVVLESLGRVLVEVGDELKGDWSQMGKIEINNLTKNADMQVILQISGVTRNDAIARTTVV